MIKVAKYFIYKRNLIPPPPSFSTDYSVAVFNPSFCCFICVWRLFRHCSPSLLLVPCEGYASWLRQYLGVFTHFQQFLSEPEFYGDLLINLKRLFGRSSFFFFFFSEQLKILTLKTPCKICCRRLSNFIKKIFLFFRENKSWYFVWIICQADDSHEISILI